MLLKMKTLRDLPLVGSLINQINQDLEKQSFQAAMRNAVARSGSKLNILGINKKLEDILKNKPTVIVANHPNDAEVMALIASMPDREDAFLVVNQRMIGVAPNIDKFLIPVYIDHHNNQKNHSKFLSFFLRRYNPKIPLTPQQEHQKNIESIAIAAKKVADGGLVIIFPGGRSVDGSWFNGVGFLLEQAREMDINIVCVNIEGTSMFDYLRIIPKTGFILPEVTITFAPPIKLKDVWDNNPKKITQNLELRYNSWVNILKT